MKTYTQKEINKKYKGKYISFSKDIDNMYTVWKSYKVIHESTTLGEDVGTEYQYKR